MTIRFGDTGPGVAKLGKDLKQLGCLVGNPTSTFDDALRRAVRAFQMQNVDSLGRPLVVDGIVGPVTAWAIANRVAQGPTPVSTSGGAMTVPAGGSTTARAALAVAVAEMNAGHGEVGGNNMGPHVAKYLNGIVGTPNDWCAGFVSFCFKTSGQPMPFKYTVGARNILDQTKAKGWEVKPSSANPPMPGDIIVWWRQAPSSWKGHVGIVHSYQNGIVRTIEGNKTSQVGSFAYTLGAIDKLLGFARVP
jgi:peptidoglycan hydrolase-like protein with peptidoglycan-binding domain